MTDVTELKNKKRGIPSAMTGGLIMIFIGLAFLVMNFTNIELFQNWWAVFILIPAIVEFSQAWGYYEADGGWSNRAVNNLISGLLIAFVSIIFLLKLDWGKIWPIFIIIPGFGALLRGLANQE